MSNMRNDATDAEARLTQLHAELAAIAADEAFKAELLGYGPERAKEREAIIVECEKIVSRLKTLMSSTNRA
jgi:hypothetical protein